MTFFICGHPFFFFFKSHLCPLFQIESIVAAASNGSVVLCSVGVTGRAQLFAAYRLLEAWLGFAFFHPLRPHVPQSVVAAPRANQTVVVASKPGLAVRGYHYHTEHPLELTEFLNGMDGSDGQSPWSSMVAEYESLLEWLVARRQNTLEWLLLWAEHWSAFAWSAERQQRLAQATGLARAWLVEPAADVAVAERQQHAWHMVSGPPALAEAQIRRAVDWLAGAGFAAISTENGFSEFTHGNCSLMLSWLNYLTEYAWSAHGMSVRIKMHCSTGQVCPGLLDPRTGQPINFNFLPVLADRRLAVMPHTVQMYRLDDPALTYGNLNFSYMGAETRWTAARGRPTIFHPETAYWVNYDINVPLFLPTYADSRLADLRALADVPLHGHITFTSGWEWAYWLNDVLVAEAVAEFPAATSLRQLLADRLAPRFFPGQPGRQLALVDALAATVDVQRRLFIWNNLTSSAPNNEWTSDEQLVNLNGMAYLTGWDTFSDLAKLGAELGFEWARAALTNPSKFGFDQVRVNAGAARDRYTRYVAPLLRQIVAQLTPINGTLASLAAVTDRSPLRSLLQEMADAAAMTLLRAQQIELLYRVAAAPGAADARTGSLMATVRSIMVQAEAVVARRQSHYRVPLGRVAFYQPGQFHANPTAYNYGYLWTVKSLHYFWRDYAIVSGHRLLDYSPCLMNIKSPVDLAVGQGLDVNATNFVSSILDQLGITEVANFGGNDEGDIFHVPEPLRALTFGSCSRHDHPQPMWAVLAEQVPDSQIFLWLGDIVYNDRRTPGTLHFRPSPVEDMAANYAAQKAQPLYQWFVGRQRHGVSGFYDDHDFGLNNVGGDYANKSASQQLVLQFLDEPAGSRRHDRRGLYGSVTFGPPDNRTLVLLLDTRYHRDANPFFHGRRTAADDQGRDNLGAEQWAWLEAELQRLAGGRAAAAAVRAVIVVSSVQVLSDTPYIERWENFPAAQDRLLRLLAARVPAAVPVVLLSGDIHQAELLCERRAGRTFYELTSSGLTHTIERWSHLLPWLMRNVAPATHRLGDVYTKLNAGAVRISPNGTVQLYIFDQMGHPIIEQRVGPSEIQNECPPQQ